jgi:hypothetical protein
MKIIALTFLLFLAACGSNQIVSSSKNVVVKPEEALYNCPVVDVFPDSKTLTDLQVARLIVKLYQNNITCKNSIESIREFLDNVKP